VQTIKMAYPKAIVDKTRAHISEHNPESIADSSKSSKKNRKKLQKPSLQPGSAARKVLKALRDQEAAKDDLIAANAKRYPNDEYNEDQNTPPAPVPARHRRHRPHHIEIPQLGALEPPTTPSPGLLSGITSPSETFLFTSVKQYKIARALFSTSYSSAASPRPEDANVRATLRWNQVMKLLTTAPVSCIAPPMKGVAVKIVRPARNNVESRSMTIHKPHGKNPRCEREVLENYASALKIAFGWEKDGFVLGCWC
jgi:hypothetical protein